MERKQMYSPLITRIELELTESCNLACKFCYNSQEPITCRNPYVLIDRLIEARVLELVLTGGEPALHPEFFDILKYSCKNIPRVMIQSNGTLFAEKDIIEKLSEYQIFCLNFSLHGSSTLHDTLTGVKGSFDLTAKAISYAVSCNFRIACNMVLTALNSTEKNIRELVSILHNLGIREMTLTRFIPCGTGSKSPELIISRKDFISALDLLISETVDKNITLLLANATPACLVPSRLHKLCSGCSFGFDKFYIDVHGNIMTCGMGRIKLGNIIKSSVQEVIGNSEIRHKYLTQNHIPEKCRQCEKLEFCRGGCRAAALAYENCIEGEDPLTFDNNR
jgi:radical SAM protein with 4Fe4S-binding SPASM domain